MKTPNPSPEPSQALATSVKRIVKPLVGLLMDNGITLQWLIRLLKEVYVEVAKEDFAINGQELTNSRISLITGVHRKDVASLLSSEGIEAPTPSTAILSARLLSKWLGDQRFSDSDGNPLALSKTSSSRNSGVKSGESCPSFEELVSSTSKDIRPKPVFEEWLNLGLIKVNQEGLIELQDSAFIPSEDHDQKLFFLGKNVSDHLAAARVNTQSIKPPFLEQSVFYDQLSDDSLIELERLARIEATKMLHAVNKTALKLQRRDNKKNQDIRLSGRMNLGAYYYQEVFKESKD